MMQIAHTRTTGVMALGLALAISMACLGVVRASTRSYGGVVEEVGPVNEKVVANPPEEPAAIRRFRVRCTFMEYVSQLHQDTPGKTGRNHPVGLLWQQRVRTRDNACMLNGELMDPVVFARALRPGLWGHIYENQWFALTALPRSEWGKVLARDGDDAFRLRVHRTHNAFHLPKNPPIEKTVTCGKGTAFQLEGKPATAAEALAPGNWVQVHPPRKQHLMVRTKAAAFDADTLTHYWNGERGAVNDLTAPARLRGYRMDDPDDAHAPATTIEVTRLRHGTLEDITFRGSFALLLDARMAPPSVALRPGRAATLVTYRSQRSPHYVFLWSDNDVIRGKIREVKAGTLTIDRVDRLTGRTTGKRRVVTLDDDALYQLNGRASNADAALKAGRTVALYPARGRTICAFAPRREDRPAFTAGGSVAGRAVGRLSRSIDERLHGGGRGPHHRMLRFDLDLGMPLQGPTRTTHRQLYLTIVTRDGKLDDLAVSNYAWHSHSPAWAAKVVKKDVQYGDGRLTGRLTLDVEPRPEGRRSSPVRGGRYRFTFDAPVRANHIADRVTMELDGEGLGQRDLTGRATVLPALIDAAPGDAVYTLTLDDPQKRVRPLTLHLEAREGQFVDGVATSGRAALYPVDTSRLQLAGERIDGPIRLHIPATHAGLQGGETLEVVIELDVDRTPGGLTGSFRGVWGKNAAAKEAH